MAAVLITNIEVLNNPCRLQTPVALNITFEANQPLKSDVEFKLTYVGSANNETNDQVLDSILVGPVPVGVNQFVFQTDPPNPSLIPHDDVLGVTAIILTCSYQDKEFIRIGYYVNNEYDDPEKNENPPSKHEFENIKRNILADKPRVTKFKISWDNDEVKEELMEFKEENSNEENSAEMDINEE